MSERTLIRKIELASGPFGASTTLSCFAMILRKWRLSMMKFSILRSRMKP